MSNNQTCPDSAVLVEFLSGRLEEDQLRSLEAHLAECDACGDTVRSLNVEDTFVELIRVNAEEPKIDAGEDAELQELLHKLESLAVSRTDVRAASDDPSADLRARVHEVESLLAPAAAEDEVGRLAHYRILSLLGTGGMGVVYQAENTQLQRLVALKILRPSLGRAARERFIQEARAAAAIEHDNVVTIYNVGSSGPLAYLAMQYLEGETLESRLKRDGRLSPDEVIHIGSQIADGVAAAHARKLIHRDIKPANIVLNTSRDRATILDFGLAYAVDDNPELTETGMIAGTPAYMSPEQAQGQSVDERSDLFSLGTMLYRMLTGKMPFAGTNALATIRAIQHDTPPTPRQVDMNIPATLSDLVMDLLEKEPGSRPDDAQLVAESLRNRTCPPRRKETVAAASPASASGNSKWRRIVIAILACGGLIAAPMIYTIATDYGQITVQTDEPNVQVEVLQGGSVVKVIDTSTDDTVTVKSGTYQLQLKDVSSEVFLTPTEVTLTRKGKEIVKVAAKRNDGTGPTVATTTDDKMPPLYDPKIAAGDAITVQVAGAIPEWPINGRFVVESSGMVPLGPVYGRVFVHGMTHEEAEWAITAKLKETLADPKVSVTSPFEFTNAPRDDGPVPRLHDPEVRAGAKIRIQVAGTMPEAPIDGDFVVEPSGKVSLGPQYGRVFIAGSTYVQAEEAITNKLKEILNSPVVQVTDANDLRQQTRRTTINLTGPTQETIQAGSQVRIRVEGTPGDQPIDGIYMVEPTGKVPLGPLYGRVAIAGMTYEQAEVAITTALKKILREPMVMVTSIEKLRMARFELKYASSDSARTMYLGLFPISRVRIESDTTTNSILAVADSDEEMAQLRTFLEQLDRPSAAGGNEATEPGPAAKADRIEAENRQNRERSDGGGAESPAKEQAGEADRQPSKQAVLATSPNHLDFGLIHQGSTVEGSVRVFAESGNNLAGSLDAASTAFVTAEPIGKRKTSSATFFDVGVVVNTSEIGEYVDDIKVTVGDGTAKIPVSATILAPQEHPRRVLVVETPFAAASGDDTSFDRWRQLVSSTGLEPHYLNAREETPVLRDIRLEKFDVILLGETGLLRIKESDISRLKNYLRQGGRLVVAANSFYVGTVEKANLIASPYGLRMANTERATIIELNRSKIREHDLTEGIDRLTFSRPSPIFAVNPESAQILVEMPGHKGRGYLAYSPVGAGEVVVLGQSLWWNWIADDSSQNSDLLRNLLMQPVSASHR